MLISLTNIGSHESSKDARNAAIVGGKGASLKKLSETHGLALHVPRSYALTAAFFKPWIDAVKFTDEWRYVLVHLSGDSNSSSSELDDACKKLKATSKSIPFNTHQKLALVRLTADMESWPLAAVRSSAPEEDGRWASYAGVLETKLGVTVATIQDAVRECFASLFDFRVFSYKQHHGDSEIKISYAAVVMEMIDSSIAGIAFSANPTNSDLDEIVINSSWGLGQSVADGTVEVDQLIWDKINCCLLEEKVGKKNEEKRLLADGDVKTYPVEEARQTQRSLSDEQVSELASRVCLIESTYGMPMDVEWAYTQTEYSLKLVLLQVRPITTLFQLDENLITLPGAPRVLYYDFNVATEATTTTHFTKLDMSLYNKFSASFLGAPDLELYPFNPDFPFFSGATRQYANMSFLFKILSPQDCSEAMLTVDPYLSSIFDSKDCNREKYCAEAWPREMTILNAIKVFFKFQFWSIYKGSWKYSKEPERSKDAYTLLVNEFKSIIKEIQNRGATCGVVEYTQELMKAIHPTINEELSSMWSFLPLFWELDKARREDIPEIARQQYDALCRGYKGDELMEMNISMYRLAKKLPLEVWEEYDHEDLEKLVARIESNLQGDTNDIPAEFLAHWMSFMKDFGFDGQDQLFISSVRYWDNPLTLLFKLRQCVSDGLKDPAITLEEQYVKRQEVVLDLEAKENRHCYNPFSPATIRKRNEILEHLMQMRNAPKLHFSNVVAIIRQEILKIEHGFIKSGRLVEKGDIFHLTLEEVDMVQDNKEIDITQIINPRKEFYERAKRTKMCPLLVDSRCRILKPDPKDHGPGVLIGSAVSPGIATGRVRIVQDSIGNLESGEVLVTTVTDSLWSPLFVRASAVILQIGGVLQHGALCARECGKPAVSGIDIRHLKTGMMVKVDGNTGVITINPKDQGVMA